MKEFSRRLSQANRTLLGTDQTHRQDSKGRMKAGLGLIEMLASLPLAAKFESSPLVVLAVALLAHGTINLIDGMRMIPKENHPPLRLVK